MTVVARCTLPRRLHPRVSCDCSWKVSKMSLYGMQRANGDWFAIKEPLRFRVPLFSSMREAVDVRAFNVEMLVFSPTIFDEHALKQVGQVENDRPVYFWLVEKTSRNMRRGIALQHEDMTLILSGGDAAAVTKD